MSAGKSRRSATQNSDPSPTTIGEDEDEVAIGFGTPQMVDGFGSTGDTPSPEEHALDANILEHFSISSKLTLPAKESPKEGQLYSEVKDGGKPVTTTYGSLQAPFESKIGDQNSLFIAGTPWVDDVAQGQIGSCYLMAVLQTAAQSFPGGLSSLFTDNGETATVHFKRYDASADEWVAAPVTTGKTTIMTLNEDGDPEALHGAGYRVASHPKSSEWWTDITDTELCINLDNTYEMALWVPIIEKAYAEYTQTHGQYGGFRPRRANDSTGEDGEALSGIDMIEGGYEELVMWTLFGNDIQESIRLDFEDNAPGATTVSPANEPLISRLLQLDGEGLKEGETALLHASSWDVPVVDNLLTYIPLVESHFHKDESTLAMLGRESGIGALGATLFGGFDDSGIMPATWYLEALKKLCEEWNDTDDDDEETAIMNQISEQCEHLIDPELVPDLHQEDTSSTLTAFLEVAAQGASAGSDNSDGQRFVYSGHAYAVFGAHFRNVEGEAIALSAETLTANLSKIDTMHSTVDMGNPHHSNEIDLHGDGPEDGVDDGLFTMTLDQFMRGFDSIQGGIVTS